MDNKQTQITKLDPKLIQKLQQWESKKPANQQLTVLSDIADMIQELLAVADDTQKESTKTLKALGAVMTDSREQLVALNAKEAPDSPDYAKPVVEAVNELKKAIKDELAKIDVKPEVKVNVPKQDAPQVNVESPSISVDLKGVEKILRQDIPKAFKEAIDSIPATEIPEAPDRWEEVIDWLKSIDTASRMVPQQPDTIKVVNPDGTDIGSTTLFTDLLTEARVENGAMAKRVVQVGSVYYIGWAAPGTATGTNAWRISKIDTSGSPEIAVTTFADGNREFDNNWDDVLILSYS